MRFLRVIFVSLIAVGVCGGVYIGLTFGLAAYMNYKAGRLAGADEAKPAGAAPAGAAPSPMPAPGPGPGPAPAMEDAAALLHRTWTAPRYGLTSPPPRADTPVAGRDRIVPVAQRPWRPSSPDATRSTHRTFDTTLGTSFSIPSSDRPPVPVGLMIAAPEQITFPAAPPIKAATPSADRLPLGAVAADRAGDRPRATDDPTDRAGEALLMQKPAPSRMSPASPETLGIPEPNPYALGGVRTELSQEEHPLIPPDRPEAVVLPVK